MKNCEAKSRHWVNESLGEAHDGEVAYGVGVVETKKRVDRINIPIYHLLTHFKGEKMIRKQ